MQNSKRDFEENHVANEQLKRNVHKVLDVNFPENVTTEFHITCNEWGHV